MTFFRVTAWINAACCAVLCACAALMFVVLAAGVGVPSRHGLYIGLGIWDLCMACVAGTVAVVASRMAREERP